MTILLASRIAPITHVPIGAIAGPRSKSIQYCCRRTRSCLWFVQREALTSEFVPPNAEYARPDETGGGDGDSDGSSGALQCDGMGWEWEWRRRSPRHKFVLKFNPNSLLNVARSRGALHRCVKSNSPLLHSQPLWPPPPLSPLLYSPPLSSPLLNSSPLWNWGRGAARRDATRRDATRME